MAAHSNQFAMTNRFASSTIFNRFVRHGTSRRSKRERQTSGSIPKRDVVVAFVSSTPAEQESMVSLHLHGSHDDAREVEEDCLIMSSPSPKSKAKVNVQRPMSKVQCPKSNVPGNVLICQVQMGNVQSPKSMSKSNVQLPCSTSKSKVHVRSARRASDDAVSGVAIPNQWVSSTLTLRLGMGLKTLGCAEEWTWTWTETQPGQRAFVLKQFWQAFTSKREASQAPPRDRYLEVDA